MLTPLRNQHFFEFKEARWHAIILSVPPWFLGGTHPHFLCHRGFSVAHNHTFRAAVVSRWRAPTLSVPPRAQIYGFITTLIQPSARSLNILYIFSACFKGTLCVIISVGSTLPCSTILYSSGI